MKEFLENYYINKKVIRAGYYFIGHINHGMLQLQFDDCSINDIKPSKIYDLFTKIFGIDPEDGCSFSELENKYCRIRINPETDEIISIKNIINNKEIYIDDLCY